MEDRAAIPRNLLIPNFAVWLLLLIGSVCARFVVEKSSITVLAPPQLRSKHDGAAANFGVPNYGGFIVGSVAYPDKGASGCEPFEGDKPFKFNKRPTVLLLDRGDCLFALKVWHAQHAGAAAVLVADTSNEPLFTMDAPDQSSDADVNYINQIEIPSVLIRKSFSDALKEALTTKTADEEVLIRLDWTESLPHPDNRVEYELWTNSIDECGSRCDEQTNFVRNFKGHAQILERGGFTVFTPHYVTWFCPRDFEKSEQCRSQCINNGRYCAPDPEKDFAAGYEGKDVVFENLRQLCVHRVAKRSGRSWVWWDYVMDFHVRCPMKEKYSRECAEDVMKSLDLPTEEIKKCVGDPEADVENEVLRTEREFQIGRGSRSDVTILPTLVINNVQFRGKLERTAVLKAICSEFKETTEPSLCSNGDIETNQCLERNGGCWQDLNANISACKDTFRGRVCECPVLYGVQYRGDGYTSCEAFGPARCSINNRGCWSETRNGLTFSACSESGLNGCQCPDGFSGDGINCQDIDECKERSTCQYDGCNCQNTWGSYECQCKGVLLYIKEQEVCSERSGSNVGLYIAFAFIAFIAGVSIPGYIIYKYSLRYYMDSENMYVMSQYMPLDQHNNDVQPENQPLRQNLV